MGSGNTAKTISEAEKAYKEWRESKDWERVAFKEITPVVDFNQFTYYVLQGYPGSVRCSGSPRNYEPWEKKRFVEENLKYG